MRIQVLTSRKAEISCHSAVMAMQALLLTLGRLAALLEGNAAFAMLAVPLLVTERASGAPMQLHACAAHVVAAVTGFCGRSNNMYA